MILPEWLVQRYGDAPRLLEMVCAVITDEILDHISVADYSMDAEMHLSELQRIRNGDRWDVPLAWEPREVMQLCRWSTEAPDLGEEGFNIMRVFCAEGLRRIGDESENTEPDDVTLLEPLMESCLALGIQWVHSLMGEMVRQLQVLDELDGEEYLPGRVEGVEGVYWMYGLYLLVVLTDPDVGEAELLAFGEFVTVKAVMMTPAPNKSFIEVLEFTQSRRDLWKTTSLLALDTGRASGSVEELLIAVSESASIAWKARTIASRGVFYFKILQVIPSAIRLMIDVKKKMRSND